MSQVLNERILLHEVLRVIATTVEPHDCYISMLQMIKQLTNSQGGFVVLFNEPQLVEVSDSAVQLPDMDILYAIAQGLPDGAQLNPPVARDTWANCVLVTLALEGELVGLWGMIDPTLQPTQLEMFDLLTHSFLIVTRGVRTDARHEKLSRNQSEFIRIVSHDLRSPLTSVQGFSSMLSMVGELNSKQQHFVEKILSGIAQMTAIVDNIQDAGRYDPETGFYEMQRSPCDLAEMVQRIVESHLLPAEKQELTIRKQVTDDIPIIHADHTMLERAITNLVDNAIKYTPNGRHITISLYRVENEIVISVADSGLGISQENQKLLFERHMRIPRLEHKRVKGSGLGLFIVRSVARRHGGKAWVESEEGHGSTFFISIPLAGDNLLFRQ